MVLRAALGFAALLVPGLACWAWTGKRGQDVLTSLAQAVAAGLALIMLVFQLGFLLRLRLSNPLIAVLLAGCAIIALAGFYKHRPNLSKKDRWHLLVGLALFGLVIAWRLYQARELLLPNWVDSQHHYLVIRAMLENDGIPSTLTPYLEMPFYYHFGFHALAVLFTQVSGMAIGPAMLLLGQVLNASISLSVYALGKALWRDRLPALGAALLVSFATRMPAYYLSWGRYTLVTGLIFLPFAMGAALNLLRKPRRRWDWATLALLTAGVLLSHYFASVLLAAFLVILGVAHLFARRYPLREKIRRLAAILASAVLGLLLALPWLVRVWRYSPARMGMVTPPTALSNWFSPEQGRYIWLLLGPQGNRWLLLATGLGLLLGLVLRKATAFALWSLGIGLMALPWTARMGPFRPDHFAIILFLPVTLWAGWFFGQAGHRFGRLLHWRILRPALVMALVGGWIGWGFDLGRNIINPVTVLVIEDDLAALDWVEANTPPEARFFINTAYWLGGVYRGVDGGGWLLPHTGRWALVPTVFYGFSPDGEWAGQIRAWGEDAAQIETCSDEFWAIVESADLDWVYLREGFGRMQPADLEGCPGIEAAARVGSVHLYQIHRD